MTTELEYKSPFELWKHDDGIDGWDAKRWLVARFTTHEKAVAYIAHRGFTFSEGCNRYAHKDVKHRHTMGKISYEIKEVKPEVPVDPA